MCQVVTKKLFLASFLHISSPPSRVYSSPRPPQSLQTFPRGCSLDTDGFLYRLMCDLVMKTHHLPGSLLISQLSCFLDIFVQLRSRVTGCLLIMPLSISGVMDLQWFKSILVHNLLSQHLPKKKKKKSQQHLIQHLLGFW